MALLLGLLGPISAFALSFQLPVTQPLPEDAPRGVLKYDIDGDNLIDVGFAMKGVRSGQTAVVIFLSDGNGGVKRRIETGLSLGARGFAAGLIDGDALPDLVLAAPDNSMLYILRGNTQGGFSRDPALDIRIPGAAPGTVQVVDLDHQGGLDLVIGDNLASGPGIYTALGNNDGTFSVPAGVTASRRIAARDLVVEDFDHDGNLDVASPGQVILGAGDGSFFPNATVSLSGGLFLAAGDLDGDGDQDLAIDGGNNVRIYLGDNRGGFKLNRIVGSPGALFRDLEVVDLDLDGINDLVLTDEKRDSVVYYLGQGNASFALPATVLTPQAPYSLAVLDQNNDSFPDIVTANDPFNQAVAAYFIQSLITSNAPPAVTRPLDQLSKESETITPLQIVATDSDIGQVLAYAAVGLPPGLSIDPIDGSIFGTVGPNAASGSPYSVVVTVTDDGVPSLSSTTNFTWIVTNTNRQPTITDPGPQSNAEGDSVNLAIVATDPDNDTLVFSATGLPVGLSIDPAAGTITGTVTFGAAANNPVSVRVTDNGTPSLNASVNFTWTITKTNRQPVVTSPGAQANAEGDSVNLAIIATDPDNDTLSFSATGLPTGLSIDPVSGAISGTVAFGATTSNVTVTATDNGIPALSASVNFLWTITNTNRQPIVTNPGAQASAEGDAVNLAIGATDPDNDPLSFSAIGLPTGLSIDPTTGAITGVVAFGANTTSVTVTATDNGTPALSASVNFTWTITKTNRQPAIIGLGAQSSAEGGSVNLAVIASDPDNGTLSYSATGLPAGLSINPVSGAISGTVGFGATTSNVSVTVTDNGTPNLSVSVNFTWTITKTNRQPAITAPGPQSSAEGDSVNLAVIASDPDKDTLSYSATGLPAGLSINPVSGAISGTVGFGATTSNVSVTVTDNGTPNLSVSVNFTWTITKTNRQPTITGPGPQSSAEGDSVNLAIIASDPDKDTLSYSATGLPAGLSIDPTTGAISGTVAFGAAASNAVTVTATDNGTPSLSANVSFTWIITNTNRQPTVIDPGPQANAEGDTIALLQIIASDTDSGQKLTYSATGLPVGLSIDNLGRISGTIDITAASGSPYQVVITVTDDGTPPLSSTVSFNWTVGVTNQAPVFNAVPPQQATENQLFELLVTAVDPDGNNLILTASNTPSGSFFTDNGDGTGLFSWTPAAAQSGNYNVLFKAVDDGSPWKTATITVTITVGTVNRPPVLQPIGALTLTEGQLFEQRVSATDPDGDRLSLTVSNLPTGAAFADNGDGTGLFSWTPSFSQAGNYQLTFKVIDDGSPMEMNSEIVTITVSDVNRPPLLNAIGAQAIPERELLELRITASDPDGDLLTLTLSNAPAGATYTDYGDGTALFSWVPDMDQSGNYTLIFTVTDQGTPPQSVSEAVSISVGSVNRPPVLDTLGDQTVIDGQLFELLVTANDPDGDLLTLDVYEAPLGSTFVDNGDGTGYFTWLPDSTTIGSHRMRFIVSDDGIPPLTGSEEIKVTVLPFDDREGNDSEDVNDDSEENDSDVDGNDEGNGSKNIDNDTEEIDSEDLDNDEEGSDRHDVGVDHEGYDSVDVAGDDSGDDDVIVILENNEEDDGEGLGREGGDAAL